MADKIIRNSANPDAPQYTDYQIKNWPGASSEMRERMLKWVKTDGAPEAPGRVSTDTWSGMVTRIHLPADGPNKITSLAPLLDAVNNRTLNRADFNDLVSKLDQNRTEDGARLDKLRARTEEAVKPSIDKSNPLQGKVFPLDKLNFARWQSFVDDKIKEYKDAKKPLADLFTPGTPTRPNPAYVGNQEVIDQFRKTLMEQTKDISHQLGLGPAAPGARTAPARGRAKASPIISSGRSKAASSGCRTRSHNCTVPRASMTRRSRPGRRKRGRSYPAPVSTKARSTTISASRRLRRASRRRWSIAC